MFQLLSPAFRNGGAIPQKFAFDGSDLSPAFVWTDRPPNTKQLAFMMENPDAPATGRTHWMVYGIPADAAGLSEGLATDRQWPDGSPQGRNSFGQVGYAGPRLDSALAHRYTFQVYALNSAVTLPPGATRRDFDRAINGHILAEAKIIGRYEAPDTVAGTTPATQSDAPKPSPAESREDRLPASEEARLRVLNQDKEYVRRDYQTQKDLGDAYAQNPDAVKAFFQRFSLTSAFAEAKIREYLSTVIDQKVRRPLEDYVRHANRFGVRFRLRTSPTGNLNFKVRASGSSGTKFHVEIVDGHLQGKRESDLMEDSYAASFASDGVDVPSAIQELIDAGKATFTRVDDHDGYSLLKDLESFAYKDDGVAIIHHDAEQPYFACIFGEKMAKALLASLGKSLTEFQKKHFFRSSGRPTKMDRLKKRLEVEAKPLSNKEKAVELADADGERKVKTEEVKLSQLRSKLRKTKS
jgi:Raf kinase inhibitor-like YbhB/YbcL family protein